MMRDIVYPCSFCGQQLKSLKGYVTHCRFHRNECNNSFPCHVSDCNRKFSSYYGFHSHVMRDHGSLSSQSVTSCRNVDISLQCSVSLCKQRCGTVADLLRHLKEHIDDGTAIFCPFSSCSNLFAKKSSFSSHLSRKHRSRHGESVRDQISVECLVEVDESHRSAVAISHTQIESSEDSVDTMLDNDTLGEMHGLDETDEAEKLYLKNLALFYLMLESKYLLPSSTVQNIVEQVKDIHCLGQSLICSKLFLKLTTELNVAEDKARDVIEEIRSCDLLVGCSDGPLRSNYTRKAIYKNLFQYVAPVSIKLGRDESGNERSFQYIPVKDSIKCLFQNKSVQNEYKATRFPSYHGYHTDDRQEHVLHDITDGFVFKNNEFFKENPDALKIILYQDSFEVCNPLGSSKKKHKILAVYMTLANFRPHLRSIVDQTLLVLLCNENYFTYFGQSMVFQPLIDDLKDLELNGLSLFEDELPVKGAVCFIAGDNLGSHCIGGFVENFSGHYYCRYCLLSSEEFRNDPCAVGPSRTEENYNVALQELQDGNDNVNNVRGVKFDSLFNALSFFHVCSPGLPPCLGHDLFEGVVNYDVALFLSYFIKTMKWFSYTELNRRIKQFKYLGSDRNNQPSTVNPSGEKLGGQAIQNWCLVRLLPILIGNKVVHHDNEVWQLFLKLRDIIDLVCSPKITESEIAYLNVTIDEYLEERHQLFPDHKLRPKHHYLKHYPGLILQCGPLIRLWTMRFESKHSYFKRCVRYSQNFKNVCLTLSERHQLMQAYMCAGSYFPMEIDIKQAVPLHVDSYNDCIQSALEGLVTCEYQLTYALNFRGTSYMRGGYLVIGADDNGLLFGEIIFMLVSPTSELYFVVRVHQSVFDFKCHIHSLIYDESATKYRCLKSDNLLDYYPLSAYGKRNALVIPLKHAIHY